MKKTLIETTSSGSVATSIGGTSSPIKNASIYGNDKPGEPAQTFANGAGLTEYKPAKAKKEK